jgi:hypothetical protein
LADRDREEPAGTRGGAEDDLTHEDSLKVAFYKDVDIFYEPLAKQFVATVNGLEIRKAAQRDVETEILKLVDPAQRVKAVLIVDRHWIDAVEAETVEVIGTRRGKVQFLRKDGERDGSRYGRDLHVYDESRLAKAELLIREHAAWEKRWKRLLDGWKRVEADGAR